MSTKLHFAIRGAAILGLASFSSAVLADDGGWNWMIAPYAWLAGVKTNLKTGLPPSDYSNTKDFGDVLDKISGAFEMHVEGHGDSVGMFADYSYLGQTGGKTRDHFLTRTQLDTSLFELAGVWNPGGAGMNGFEVFGGLRYINADLEFKLTPDNPEFPTVKVQPGKSYSDLMLGARYTFPLSDRWALTLRGDGSGGQTDGTWNVSGVAQYKTSNGAWLFGYRYLDISLKSHNVYADVTVYGPQIGYGFKF